ncbi:MAG: 16S rRNA (guanine(527)-N(7))-methyltransferase RsmG [bacterium]|nr:16S rRNA (guanine(527)-N(7))-methyltransferase RsmG [bacterium]
MNHFEKYSSLLLEESKKISLTGYKSRAEIFEKLINPSIKLSAIFKLNSGARIIDVGSGIGIPGIPMAIEMKEMEIYLVESIKKKIDFLNKAKSVLSLNNIEIITGRAEEFGRKEEFREQFDISVCRAIGGLGVSLELLSPFCMVGGKVMVFRGNNEKGHPDFKLIEEELGLKFQEILTDIYEGKVWIFNKIDKIDDKYPRKPGIPEKRERFIKK